MSTSIAFFGATGGSTVACLAFALEAGYTCSACKYLLALRLLDTNQLLCS